MCCRVALGHVVCIKQDRVSGTSSEKEGERGEKGVQKWRLCEVERLLDIWIFDIRAYQNI